MTSPVDSISTRIAQITRELDFSLFLNKERRVSLKKELSLLLDKRNTYREILDDQTDYQVK